MRAVATLTYTCLINNRSVIETFTDYKEAKARALHLSKMQLAKSIKIIRHAH
jgi:hypothetical protein